jgi:hypothetical protein
LLRDFMQKVMRVAMDRYSERFPGTPKMLVGSPNMRVFSFFKLVLRAHISSPEHGNSILRDGGNIYASRPFR